MIKKIAYLGAVALLTTSIVSCEKDFTEVGSTIIDNSKFNTKELIFDVEITQQNIEKVRAGNTEIANLGEYLLGVYKKPNAQTLNAGIVSQLTLPTVSDPTLEDGESLSDPILDEVILKIPVNAVLRGKIDAETTDADGNTVTIKVPDFRIDSILGNTEAEFAINVYRNGTFLTDLDPTDPSKKRKYYSNQEYIKEGVKLNPVSTIDFKNIATDTSFIFDRTLSNGDTYKDTLKVDNGTTITANPFIAVKLDKAILKTELFDKLINSELSSDTFNEYFKGIIIEVEGTDGALVPLNLALTSNNLRPSIDLISTTTIIDGNNNPVLDDDGEVKKVENVYSFSFAGVRTSTYTMSGTASATNGLILQGTAGSVASIKILEKDTDNNGVTDLEELRKSNIIINDAQLVVDINTAIDTTSTPKRLFMFKNEADKNTGNIVPTHLGDLLTEGPDSFDGILKLDDEKPDYYSFSLRKHLSDIIKGNIPNSELILRVLNSNDFPTSATDLDIKNYNWNARSVPLLSNSTQQGTVRGIKLKVSYTEEK